MPKVVVSFYDSAGQVIPQRNRGIPAQRLSSIRPGGEGTEKREGFYNHANTDDTLLL